MMVADCSGMPVSLAETRKGHGALHGIVELEKFAPNLRMLSLSYPLRQNHQAVLREPAEPRIRVHESANEETDGAAHIPQRGCPPDKQSPRKLPGSPCRPHLPNSWRSIRLNREIRWPARKPSCLPRLLSQQDVRPPARHVGGNRDPAFSPGLRDDVRLLSCPVGRSAPCAGVLPPSAAGSGTRKPRLNGCPPARASPAGESRRCGSRLPAIFPAAVRYRWDGSARRKRRFVRGNGNHAQSVDGP